MREKQQRDEVDAIKAAPVKEGRLLRQGGEPSLNPDMPDRYELNEMGEVISIPKPTARHQRVIGIVVSVNLVLPAPSGRY